MTEHQQTSQQDRVRRVRRRPSTSAQLLRLLKLSAHLVSILDPHEMIAALIPSLVAAMPSVQAGMLWLDQQRRLSPRALFGLPLTPAALQISLPASCVQVRVWLVVPSLLANPNWSRRSMGTEPPPR